MVLEMENILARVVFGESLAECYLELISIGEGEDAQVLRIFGRDEIIKLIDFCIRELRQEQHPGSEDTIDN